VIISDTFGRPWRVGIVNVAVLPGVVACNVKKVSSFSP